MRVPRDDYSLWQTFKNGDKESFQTIYCLYFKNLFEYGMRVVSDKELVKDTIHDLFVKLWNHKANLGEVTAIRSYLLVSLRSTLYNKVRQGSRMVVTELNESLPFEMVFSVESEFIKKENQSVQTQKLIEALNQLTARQKEVIYLRYFEEMEYEEIAGIMNITVKATYKLTARGLDALRQILDVSPSSLILFLALAKADLFNWQAVIC